MFNLFERQINRLNIQIGNNNKKNMKRKAMMMALWLAISCGLFFLNVQVLEPNNQVLCENCRQGLKYCGSNNEGNIYCCPELQSCQDNNKICQYGSHLITSCPVWWVPWITFLSSLSIIVSIIFFCFSCFGHPTSSLPGPIIALDPSKEQAGFQSKERLLAKLNKRPYVNPYKNPKKKAKKNQAQSELTNGSWF